MNYYKFNVGDYSAATRHLSMLEHGAYRLLLDVYYTTEKPLPADLKAAARKAGARSKDEVAAVETVLGEFFHLTADGWVNNRCAVEIESYKAKTETNRVVGKMGGRPKKITQTVSENNPDGFQNETQTVSKKNPNHKPLTNNQEYPHTPSVAGGLVDQKKPSAVSLEAWLDDIKARGEQPIPPTDPVFAYAEEAGIPMEHMRLAWAEFRARYCEPGSKRYRDWRTVYRKAVRGNWFKLWFCTADGEYALTTTGQQALRSMQAKQAAREGVAA